MSSLLGGAFDRMIGSLHGLPDVLHTRTSTVRVVIPIIGGVLTYSVQTYRKKDDNDKYVFTTFLEIASAEGLMRVILPDKVLKAIIEQRFSLQTKGRKLKGKELAAERKAAGIEPGFMKGKRKKIRA